MQLLTGLTFLLSAIVAARLTQRSLNGRMTPIRVKVIYISLRHENMNCGQTTLPNMCFGEICVYDLPSHFFGFLLQFLCIHIQIPSACIIVYPAVLIVANVLHIIIQPSSVPQMSRLYNIT